MRWEDAYEEATPCSLMGSIGFVLLGLVETDMRMARHMRRIGESFQKICAQRCRDPGSFNSLFRNTSLRFHEVEDPAKVHAGHALTQPIRGLRAEWQERSVCFCGLVRS